MYEDKYENHFLNIESGRARFATFARFTLNGLLLPGTPPALAALADEFGVKLTAFETGVVQRTAGAGSAQGSTATEDETWELVQALIHKLDIEKVQPAYHSSSADLEVIYPDKLSGLTQAKLALRLTRFTAYTQALEARQKVLTTGPGEQARALLKTYKTAFDTKQGTQKEVDDTIATLGPAAVALCGQLWEAHTLALYTFRATPGLAAAFFDYDLLPVHKYVPVADRPTPDK